MIWQKNVSGSNVVNEMSWVLEMPMILQNHTSEQHIIPTNFPVPMWFKFSDHHCIWIYSDINVLKAVHAVQDNTL